MLNYWITLSSKEEIYFHRVVDPDLVRLYPNLRLTGFVDERCTTDNCNCDPAIMDVFDKQTFDCEWKHHSAVVKVLNYDIFFALILFNGLLYQWLIEQVFDLQVIALRHHSLYLDLGLLFLHLNFLFLCLPHELELLSWQCELTLLLIEFLIVLETALVLSK